MSTFDLLSMLSSFILGGGLVGVFTIRYKRKKEKTSAASSDVDYTTKLAKEYQDTTLSLLTELRKERKHSEQVQQDTTQIILQVGEISTRLQEMQDTIKDVVEYLNGDFAEFRSVRRGADGRFLPNGGRKQAKK